MQRVRLAIDIGPWNQCALATVARLCGEVGWSED
jgi:hypothetical protein